MHRFLLMILVVSFSPGLETQKKKTEAIPPLNEKVVAFARSHLGQPVGDGICVTLAVEALDAAGAKRFPFDRSGDYVWGEEVADFKDVLPGDIHSVPLRVERVDGTVEH